MSHLTDVKGVMCCTNVHCHLFEVASGSNFVITHRMFGKINGVHSCEGAANFFFLNGAQNAEIKFRLQSHALLLSYTSQVCKLCQIRRHFSLSTAQTIIVGLINSGLDYCDSLLNNIAKTDLSKPQRAQNCLSRVVIKTLLFIITAAC